MRTPPSTAWMRIIVPPSGRSEPRDDRLGLAQEAGHQLPRWLLARQRRGLPGKEREQARVARLRRSSADLPGEGVLDGEGGQRSGGHLACEAILQPARGAAGEGARDHGGVVAGLAERRPEWSAGAGLGTAQEGRAPG